MECALFLSLAPGIGPVRYRSLIQYFGSAEHAWHGRDTEIEHVLGNAAAEKFISFRSQANPQKIILQYQQKHIQWITIEEDTYPHRLRRLPDAPPVLFCIGNTALLNRPAVVAIVGTRKPTSYGRAVTISYASECAINGCVIVSGLALGVDGIAHQATLDANGETIAVLGSGVDVCTPGTHQGIYRRISQEGGLIVSAYPAGTPPSVGTFPARNRIIAGLSDVVCVTEAAAESGGLITAGYMREIGGMVCAIPGPVTSSVSAGTNRLLKEGAVCVTSPQDIYASLVQPKEQKNVNTTLPDLDDDESRIYMLLMQSPLHFDAIVRTIGKPAQAIGMTLSSMELKGVIISHAGQYRII